LTKRCNIFLNLWFSFVNKSKTMKRKYSIATAILVSAAFVAQAGGNKVPGSFRLAKSAEEEDKAKIALEAARYRNARLVDVNGEFDLNKYYQAVEKINARQQSGNRAGALNLNWEFMGPDNVGGRTRAILIDNRDPSRNTVWAGGVGGGLWKSTDGANNWSETNCCDFQAISCIAQDKAGNIYVGTGEGHAQPIGISLNSGQVGNGVYKIKASDGTVEHIVSTRQTGTLNNSHPWAMVNRLAINPNNDDHIIAATSGGLYETTNGGTSWTLCALPNGYGGSTGDVKWSKDGTTVFASVGGGNGRKLVRSTNSGLSWEAVATLTNPGFPAQQGRIEVAIAPSDPNYVYISIATTSGCTFAVYRTTDRGNTWSQIGFRGPLFDPFGPNCQGWYDNVIAVSPIDPNKLYLGGIDLFCWSDQSGWKLSDVGLGGGNANPNYIHPDKHSIVIDDVNPEVMYVGCDGGVYKSTNAVSAFPFPNYQIKNKGYNVTQFYSVAASLSGEVMGGTQDNGTQFVNLRGNTRQSAEMVYGGDGIYVDFSHIDRNVSFAGVYYGEVKRSGNGGGSYVDFFDIKIDPRGESQPSRCGGQENSNAPFITPFFLGETTTATNSALTVEFEADRDYQAGEVVTAISRVAKTRFTYTLTAPLAQGASIQIPDPIKSRLFLSSFCGVWMTTDALDLANIPRWYRLNGSTSMGTPLSFAMSKDGNVLYVGTDGGRVYRFSGLNTADYTQPAGSNVLWNPTTGGVTMTFANVASGRRIEGISVDENDPDHVLAVVAGFGGVSHVFRSTNATSALTFNNITNDLPDIPVYDVVIDRESSQNYIIGTEFGVFSSNNGGANWTYDNEGLPRVAVFRLRQQKLYEEDCPVLYIGTHGRGLYRSTSITPSNCKLVAGNQEPSAEVDQLGIYPNPASNSATLEFELKGGADVRVSIIDLPGRVLATFNHNNLSNGKNSVNLDLSSIPAGTYLAAVTADGNFTTSRLFVVSK
jgi:hypothetical protein